MIKYILLLSIVSYSLFSTAQVHVRDEPRHHNVFENEFIRILDVHLGPKDTTLYHLHNTPSVFIKFSNSNVGSQLMGGQPQKGANVNGEVTYDDLATSRTHRVWNEDTSWFHVMDIELTSTKQKNKLSVLQNPFLKLLFNEQQVNGYSIELKPGNEPKLPASAKGYLLISQSTISIDHKINGVTQHRIVKPSHYIWIGAGKKFSLKATDNSKFVLLELK
jgi:hypothetical protein